MPGLPERDVGEPGAGQGLEGGDDGSAVTGPAREESLVVLIGVPKKAVPAGYPDEVVHVAGGREPVEPRDLLRDVLLECHHGYSAGTR